MKKTLSVLLLYFIASPYVLFAYVAIPAEFPVPYVPYEITVGPEIEQIFLAELDEYPHLYEFLVMTPQTTQISLRLLPGTDIDDFRPAMILVRDIEPNGVEEVTRFQHDTVTWQAALDPRSRLAYQKHNPLFVTLEPGVYRLEVSAPANEGKYMLVIGEDMTTPSIGTTFRTVRDLYRFYEISLLGMIKTPVVFYPLGIILILILFGSTWIWQRNNKAPQKTR